MADRTQRHADNVDGKWYVDKSCILCNLCSEAASQSFKKSDLGEYDVVYNQPHTPEEVEAAEDAMSQCPVDAIGNDGE